MSYNHYFNLLNLDKIYPSFWLIVSPKYLHNDNLSYEQLKKLDEDIDFLDVDKDNISLLPKQSKATCESLEPIYQKGLHFYQEKIKAEQAALLQHQQHQQQYQYQFYQQQQQVPNYQQYSQYSIDPNYEAQMAYQQQYNQNTYQQGFQGYQQGHQQPQQGYQQQQQGYPPAYQSGYQNNYQQQQNNYGYNQGGYQNNYGHQNQRGHHNPRNYEQNQHNQHNQHNRWADKNAVNGRNYTQQTKTQQNRIQSQSTVVSSEKKTEPEKVIVKVEPPKPEKKKLTIEEIRKMIASVVDKQQLKKTTNPKLVEQIQEVKNWEKKVESFQIQKPSQEYDNKKNKGNYPKKYTQHENQSKEGGNQEFNRGAKYDPKRQQPTASAGFDIKIGKNQNLETRIIKDKFNKAAKRDFALQKEQEQNSLSKIENATREMLFSLNRVAPQNLKEIFKEIEGYALKDKQICDTLVDLIIQKAWEQPKYAASYAKLSSYYCKIDSSKFEYGGEQGGDKKKRSNEFKQLLIEKVQHSFDKKQKTIPKDEQDPQKYARETKNQIMGNVKFIAELIKIKLIHKKITKYCVAKLLESFLEGRYLFLAEKKTQNNFYEFSFEAIIEFLENLAEKFDAIDEKQKDQEVKYNLKEIQEQVVGICELKVKPKQIAGLQNLKAQQYFEILELVRSKGLKQSKEGGRLGALLQNLVERKNNNWKRHHVQAEKPTKLKDVNKEEEPVLSPEERAKLQSKQANQKIKKVFKKLMEGDNKTLQELDNVYKKHTFSDFIGAFFTQVSDDKKDNIPKRLQLFDAILSKYLEKNNLLDAWKKNFQNLSFLGSEFPYLAAALAKILIKYVESKKGSYNDFFIKYDEDEQEDEYFFMQNLFQKLYHYTKEEEIKKVVAPKQKQSHLL